MADQPEHDDAKADETKAGDQGKATSILKSGGFGKTWTVQIRAPRGFSRIKGKADS